MLCTDVVNYLLDNFKQCFCEIRAQLPPDEGQTLEGPLDTGMALAQHVSVLGRDSTIQHFVYWLAVIFRRWVTRGGVSDNEFYRGLVHLTLLCTPWAGMDVLLEGSKRSMIGLQRIAVSGSVAWCGVVAGSCFLFKHGLLIVG